MGYICDEGIYVIIPVVSLTEEMLNIMRQDFNVIGDVFNNSLRKNNTGTKVILKFKNTNVNTFNAYRWYSYSEILNIIQESEWNN